MVFSLTLIPPIIISLIYKDGGTYAFSFALSIMLFTGFVTWYPNRKYKRELKIRDGFIIVVMFWTVLGLAGALPMYFSNATEISITDAIFESFSGLTTTGATILTGLDSLPHSLLWYRQQLQWLGGMGIIVLAVAIMPMLGIGGMQLYKAETPGPVKGYKLAPRISETAKSLWKIYLLLTASCAIAYWLAGMNGFDAITHSFSTIAIGGFSTHDASIGYFDNGKIEAIVVFFMFVASINFALHFSALRQANFTIYRIDPEVRTLFLLLFFATIITTSYLYIQNEYVTLAESFRFGIFQTVSTATTTGFSNVDYTIWPAFIPVMLIFMSFVGGTAGSTAGGMKVIRVILIFKQGSRELKHILHPNAIIPVKIQGKAIPETVISAVWGFFALYIIVFIIIMLTIMAMGLDQVTAFSAVAAMINNLGPGLGEISSNYQALSDPIKWVLTFTMLLGRLEIFTLIVLFTRVFWKT